MQIASVFIFTHAFFVSNIAYSDPYRIRAPHMTSRMRMMEDARSLNSKARQLSNTPEP